MVEPLIAGMDSDGSGSIDVAKELESLKKFGELGMDIEEMEDLLFKDIEKYKKIKLLLLKQEIHGIPPDQYLTPSPPEEEEDMEILGMGDESNIKIDDVLSGGEEELLLYGANIEGSESVVEDPTEVDISLILDEDVSYSDNNDDSIDNTIEKDIINETTHESNIPETSIEPNFGDIYRKKRRYRTVIIGSISIFVIILLLSSFLITTLINNDPNEEVEPKIELLISDINPNAGNLVSFTGLPDEDDISYLWNILPDDYRIITGDKTSERLEVFFTKPRTFEIRLEIDKNGKKFETFETVNVQERSISLERERYGDVSKYKVEGHVEYNDLKEMKRTVYLGLDYSQLEADFWTTDSSPVISSIQPEPVNEMDGLGAQYLNLRRTTNQNLKLSGTVRTDSNLGPQGSLTGTVSMVQVSNVDLFNKRPTSFISDVGYDLDVQLPGNTVSESSDERIWTYPSLSNTFSDLRVEDISSKRNITFGDSGTTQWGSYTLTWEALEYDRIMDIPSLMLNMEIDQASRQRLGITDLDMNIWIGDGIPQLISSVMNISSSGNDLDHSQTMIEHEMGDKPVVFGLLENHHDTFQDAKDPYPDLTDEFHSNWVYYPSYGNKFSSIPADLDAQIAISSFEESPNFKNFLRSRDDPFGLYSNFSRVLGKDQWRLSIGDKGDDRCWNQTVWRETNPPGLTDNIDPVKVGKDEIGSLISYSGAETALKRLLSIINKEGARAVFGVNSVEDTRKLDMDNFAICTKADMEYPLIGLIDPTLTERIPYAFYISSADSTTEVGLDMSTGQLAYVRLVL